MFKITWNNSRIYIGKHVVGRVAYQTFVTRRSTMYKATCLLPGIKPTIGTFDTEQRAKTTLELVVLGWIGACNEPQSANLESTNVRNSD